MKVVHCLFCGSDKLSKVAHRSDGVGILECEVCGLMMVETINDHTESLYDKDYFEKEGATDYGYSGYISSPAAKVAGKYGFARLFKSAGRHLDLGSADGSLIEVFSQDKFTSQGLEISQYASHLASQKGLDVAVSNLHSFPAGWGGYDIITAFDLLEHVDKLPGILKNIYESLNKEGVFVFSTLSVKKKDTTEYWFNNSLEHYLYFTEKSLRYILGAAFGESNFAFFEKEVNGIAEIWGFATKGNPSHARQIVEDLKDSKIPKAPDEAYFLSLFYDQVSEFKKSKEIVDMFSVKWTPTQVAEAKFYLYYFQGKIEKALKATDDKKLFVPSLRGVFWRAYYQAEKDYSEIVRKEMRSQSDAEIVVLRETVFKLNDELHNLRGSRVVGRIIIARDVFMGTVVPAIKSSPKNLFRGAIHYTKLGVGVFLPMETKKKIGAKKRYLIRKIKAVFQNELRDTAELRYVDNLKVSERQLVSVVIPYYNRADTIDDTLHSLEVQTYKGFEVIVVDDGSPDVASRDKADRLVGEYSSLNLRMIRQDNAGVAVARNHGIKAASGRYIICLDSDDILGPTYIEKCTIVLESDPSCSLVTSYRKDFGVRNEIYKAVDYDPLKLYEDNMVTTASAFRKTAWEKTGGYKPNIGYEDWEFWLSLAENGDWGRTLREPLFEYRVAMQSRFAEDKAAHWGNIRYIKELHKGYKAQIKRIKRAKSAEKVLAKPETAFINLSDANAYVRPDKSHILIAVPWMTFGGAETLIYNYCRGLKDQYDLAFVTGIPSDHEWEYKFRELTEKIFHLPQLFSNEMLYLEFLSHYIAVHDIQLLHIIHSGYVFDMLPELKRRHPHLKIAVTMFNDRVEEYVEKTVKYEDLIDSFNTDSIAVAESFKSRFRGILTPKTIPNGVDCFNEFNPALFDRSAMREELHIDTGDKAIFFVGRLSEEKNPDIFIKAMDEITRKYKAKAFIVGDGPMRQECEALLRGIKNKNIIDLGYQTDVARYLSASDIFVLPSSVEGFPLSILEAMSMRVAVIASKVGAVPDVIEDGKNGFVVTPGSVKEIQLAVRKLMDDMLLNKVKDNNRREAEEMYSNQQLSARYSALYREVLK